MTPWSDLMLQAWLTWLSALRTPVSLRDLVDINDLVDITGPTLNVNMQYPGNRRVEVDVYSRVARPGTQLGIIADAVLELANAAGHDGENVKRLQEMVDEINKSKRSVLEGQVNDSLVQMKKANPTNFREELERMLRELDS